MNDRELWPCLGTEGLEVFATTADQRYLLGEDVFLATHFPITLRRFPPDRPVETMSEAELLNRLTSATGIQRGNRLFILYGAAGSGKSELMKWLQVMIGRNDPNRSDVMVRIPRTELDVLRIAERFHHLLSESYFSEMTHRRWETARRKPRTLAKLLLLTALERSLDSDEQINALYYRMLDWIEPHISRGLALTDNEEDQVISIDLLTREDLEELKTETALSVPLDYEQFRHHLLEAFQEHLLEGLRLPDTLRLIAEDVDRKGLRPILLIDDLVQSINLFATDLLDYFLTLNSGNWDVVIGLTPAALSASDRGRELLDRITYLDTIDDRVEKLWLSDMQGHDSYFLNEESCSAFAAPYLEAYRTWNGWECASCPHRPRCVRLGKGAGFLLAPFNKMALCRVFQGLPEGKGKARYFLRSLREILEESVNQSGVLAALSRYARLDTAVEAQDPSLARLAELYGPPVKSGRQVTLSADLLAAFELGTQPVSLPAETLKRQRTHQSPSFRQEDLSDPARAAIKSWLDGEPVNRQSLHQLRKEIARWIREVYPVDALHAPGIARPHKVLRWRKIYLGVRPPIILEDVDEGEGILVTRKIGLTAFRLYDFAEVTGDERKALIALLASEERLLPFLQAAADYHWMVSQRLEKQLEMPIEELALALYTWLAFEQGVPEKRPPGFGGGFWERIEKTRAQFPIWQGEPDEALYRSVRYLFDDFFRLRKNVYDGSRIVRRIGGRAPEALLEALMEIAPEQVDKDYRLRKKPLKDVLATVQKTIEGWHQPQDEDEDLSAAAQAVVETLRKNGKQGVSLHKVPSEVFSELRDEKPNLYAALRVVTALTLGAESHDD